MTENYPNLFIVGAAKSGTTTLADSLQRHPDVFIIPYKESYFFSNDVDYARGMDWYLNTFFSEAAVGYLYRCDATTAYLYYAEKVAPRIKTDLPGQAIKFIAIFRNPIDRAYSHYWHNVNMGNGENLSFEEALQKEGERLTSEQPVLNELGRTGTAYFGGGLYARQLRAFWKYFRKDDFLLLLHEDLDRQEFPQTMQRVQTFLQVPPVTIQYTHSNVASKPRSRSFERIVRSRSVVKELMKLAVPAFERRRLKATLLRMNSAKYVYPPMDPSTREMLNQKYAPEIKEFEPMINRDLSTWLG